SRKREAQKRLASLEQGDYEYDYPRSKSAQTEMLSLSCRQFCPRVLLLLPSRCGQGLLTSPPSPSRVPKTPTTGSRAYAKKATKKRKGGGVGGSSLSEEERDVIDLSHTEAAMQASVTALKKEYTINLVTRLTPASLDSLYVDVEGQSVPLRQLGQSGMPNPNTLVLNLASYPQDEQRAAGIHGETGQGTCREGQSWST
ncbi:Ribosome-recycling factor, mitochondrial, partial [Geodia barretti]